MIFHPDNDFVYSTIDKTLKRLNKENLLVHVEWNKRRTGLLGTAQYCNIGGKITLSSKMWDIQTKEEKEELVIHEVCHIVQRHLILNNYVPQETAHGQTWKKLMKKCGIFRPRASKNLENQEAAMKISNSNGRKKVEVECNCGRIWIGQTIAKRMAKGQKYICRRCRGNLRFISSGDVAAAKIDNN